MEDAPSSEIVEKFLFRVIEIEESPVFLKKGQDSARKDEINKALDEFCK